MSDDDLRPLPDAPNWRTQANCHPTNRPDTTTPAEWTDRWFNTIWHDWAAQQCAACPVTGPCADEGRDQIGMWAGDAREVSGVQPKTCKWCRGLVEAVLASAPPTAWAMSASSDNGSGELDRG